MNKKMLLWIIVFISLIGFVSADTIIYSQDFEGGNISTTGFFEVGTMTITIGTGLAGSTFSMDLNSGVVANTGFAQYNLTDNGTFVTGLYNLSFLSILDVATPLGSQRADYYVSNVTGNTADNRVGVTLTDTGNFVLRGIGSVSPPTPLFDVGEIQEMTYIINMDNQTVRIFRNNTLINETIDIDIAQISFLKFGDLASGDLIDGRIDNIVLTLIEDEVVNITGPNLTQVQITPSNPNQSSNLSANSTYTNNDNGTVYIEKISDLNITNNGTISVPGEFGQAVQFDGIDDYLNFTPFTTFQNTTLTEMTWAWWMNSSGQSVDARGINRKWSEITDNRSWFIETQGAAGAGVRIRLSSNGVTSAQTLDTAFFINDGEWHYYVITFNGSLVGDNLMFYVDGALNSNNTNSRTSLFSNIGIPILLGESEDLVDPLNGSLDEVRIWKKSLSHEEVNETMIDNASFALDDLILYMDYDFARANVTVNWSKNGGLNQTTTFVRVRNNTVINNSYFCPVFACVDSDLINVSFNAVDFFGNLSNVTDQVEINDTGTINISATEKVSGNNINTFNISLPSSLSTTTGNITFVVEVDTLNVTGQASSYLNTVSNNTETAVFNATTQIVLPGFYSSNITLNVTDLINGSIITGFNWTVVSLNFSFNESGNSSIINLINGTYNLTVQHPNYLDNQSSFIVNSSALQLDIQLFVTNSFNLTFRYEISNTIVDDRNVSVAIVSSFEAFNFTVTNGTLFVSMITPAIVDIRYESVGFRERSFFFNLLDKSLNNLTLYMLDSVNGTLIIVTNVDETGAPVEGVTMQLLRGFIEDSVEEFRVVEMDETDFAGEAVITAEQNDVRYIIRTVRNVSSNEILFLSNPFEITGTTLRITLDLLADPLASFNTWRTITFTGPTFNATSDNITGNWTASYNDIPGLINPGGEVCLVVEEAIGVERLEFDRSCSSSTTANLRVEYTGTRGTYGNLIADTNTENSLYVLNAAENLFNIRTRIATALGGSGAFWSAAIIYSVSTMLIFNPATFIYGIIGGLISVWFLGFASGTFVGFIALIIMGGIVAFKLRT